MGKHWCDLVPHTQTNPQSMLTTLVSAVVVKNGRSYYSDVDASVDGTVVIRAPFQPRYDLALDKWPTPRVVLPPLSPDIDPWAKLLPSHEVMYLVDIDGPMTLQGVASVTVHGAAFVLMAGTETHCVQTRYDGDFLAWTDDRIEGPFVLATDDVGTHAVVRAIVATRYGAVGPVRVAATRYGTFVSFQHEDGTLTAIVRVNNL
jgi:hypothetical protein